MAGLAGRSCAGAGGMRNDPATPAQSFGDVLKGIVLRMIEAERGNPAEQKARILIAHQHGHISTQEAEDWIRVLDLKAA